MGGTQTMKNWDATPLDFSQFSGGLQGKESFIDIDAETEKNGHFLVIEWKELPKDPQGLPYIPLNSDGTVTAAYIPDGQRISLERKATTTPTTVLIVPGIRTAEGAEEGHPFKQIPCTLQVLRNQTYSETKLINKAMFDTCVKMWRDEVTSLPTPPVYAYPTANPFIAEKK